MFAISMYMLYNTVQGWSIFNQRRRGCASQRSCCCCCSSSSLP